jgi:GDP-D-mannose 3', 5'-epimerase
MYNNKKCAVVLGAGGFIGGHLVQRLKTEGYFIIGADIKRHEYFIGDNLGCDTFHHVDLRDNYNVCNVIHESYKIDEVYQLAADMGGAGYIFSGENDANVMHNSALINLNVVDRCRALGIKNIFYSSSACMYPEHNQLDPENPNCAEDSAYPANPDSEYGWEKLFSERLYLAYNRNYGMNAKIARFHNIFGPNGTWKDGKEKAPAAISRKVAAAKDGDAIEVWGDGLQTRSFLYVDECVDGILKLMRHETFNGPVNIGSDEMISINDFTKMIIEISGKNLTIKNIKGPNGVRGRNSDNSLIFKELGWKPTATLKSGIIKTYNWIKTKLNE